MSRSDDEKRDRPPAPEVFFVGGRLQRDSVSAGGFEAFISTTLGLWMTALFVVFRTVYELKLEDADLAITAEASATLAGLALAFLTLIYQLNPGDRFLKMGFAFLTFVLLLSTILVVMAVLVYEKSFEAAPRVEVWFLSSAVLLAPLLGRRFAKEKWSKFEHVAYLLPFLIPLPLVSAISERKLLTGSLLLLLLAVIGLPILMIAFVYGTLKRQSEETAEEKFFNASVVRWQRRIDEERLFEELKDKIIDILKRRREGQLEAFRNAARDGTGHQLDTDDLLTTTEDLNSHPSLRNESRELIDRAIDELTDRKLVYSDYYSASGRYHHTRQHYLAPTWDPSSDEIEKARAYIRKHSVIVFRSDEARNIASKDLRLTRELALKFCYPRSVIAKHLLVPLSRLLKEEYLVSDSTSWEVYVRRSDMGPRKALLLYYKWIAAAFELAKETGMRTHANLNLGFTSVKWHIKEKGRDGQPRWVHVLKRDPETKALMSREVLPKNFEVGSPDSINLLELFDELGNMESRLKSEAGDPGESN